MNSHTLFRVGVLFLLLFSFPLSPGCWKKGLDVQFVEGNVTLDGQPFGHVVITFNPVEGGDGRMGYASTNEKGYYRLSTMGGRPDGGTTLGQYVVTFTKEVPAGKQPTEEEKAANPNWEMSGKYNMDRVKELVPKKYVDPKTSGFEITVEKGKNKFDFDLFSK